MSDVHSIRIARPDDFEAVGALVLASFSRLLSDHYDREILDRALPFLTRANMMLLASGTYYVAQSATGELLGCGGWTPARPGSDDVIPGQGHIRHFATHPEWLGRGIGTSLLIRCFADAAPHARSLYCYSTLNAEPFYRSCGFEAVEPIEVPFGPDVKFPAILMRRELESQTQGGC